jgi:hypothetical protein
MCCTSLTESDHQAAYAADLHTHQESWESLSLLYFHFLSLLSSVPLSYTQQTILILNFNIQETLRPVKMHSTTHWQRTYRQSVVADF